MSGNRQPKHILTPFEAWALALGCIVGWGSFVMPGTAFLPMAGPAGAAIVFACAAAVMALIALNFHFMMNHHPVSGGAFAYANRAFGRTHGYICGWFLVLAYLAIIPQNATALATISRDLMGNILEIGPSYSLAGYDTFLIELIMVGIVLAAVLLVAIRNTKALAILQSVFACCIVVGVGIVAVAIWLSPASSVTNLQPAFAPNVIPLVGLVGVLTVTPWAFVGFDTISQMAGEASFSMRRTGGIMVGAIVTGGIIYILLNSSSIAVLPASYGSWVDYIKDLPNLEGIQSIPIFNAVYLAMGAPGLVILDVAALGAIFTGIVGFTLVASRLLAAMADADVLPEWIGRRHPKYGTPRNALITIMASSLALACLGRAVLGWIVDMSSVGISIAFLYTSLATARFAREQGKPGWRALGIVGAILSAAFVFILLVPIPAAGSALDVGSYVMLITWAVLGINFFTPEYRSKTAIANMPDDFEDIV